ncbi:MAG: FKBP-type peptidyl-prolyl cis-trans isomerase [Prevotella sp.]|nr:FKBP-type peptidyl-prolyl cis-trans isomerase [Prevotella sp.]
MDNKQNKYISVAYQLFTIGDNGERHIEEQTEQGRPFKFISGFGFTHDNFEQQIENLEPGTKFDFTLQPEEAFGPYYEEGVHKMPREEFEVDGKFDAARIYPGAVITLLGEDDKRLMARVVKVEDDGVTLDANHPLAGKALQFIGIVLENRPATTEEIQRLLNHMSHECGGCGGCSGGCDDCDGEEDGCGHCQH